MDPLVVVEDYVGKEWSNVCYLGLREKIEKPWI